MKRILVDTSVLVDFLRRKDKEGSLLVKLLSLDYQLVISLITHTELHAGKSVWQNKTALRELEELISGLEIIKFDQDVSILAGKIQAKYQLGLIDAIIAAETIISNIPLVTLNQKHFQKIKGVEILKV